MSRDYVQVQSFVPIPSNQRGHAARQGASAATDFPAATASGEAGQEVATGAGRWDGAPLAVLVTVIVTAGSVRSAVARRYPGLPAAQHAVNVNLVTDYIGASIGIAVWLVLIWALVRGRDRARIALMANFGAMSLSMLIRVAAWRPRTSGRGGNAASPFGVSRLSEMVRSEKLGCCEDGV